mgnify:CR=1 FL=1
MQEGFFGENPSCTSPRPPQSPEGLAPITQLVRCAELASNRWAVGIRLAADGLRVGLQCENMVIPLFIRVGGGDLYCIKNTCRGFRPKTPCLSGIFMGFPLEGHWSGWVIEAEEYVRCPVDRGWWWAGFHKTANSEGEDGPLKERDFPEESELKVDERLNKG